MFEITMKEITIRSNMKIKKGYKQIPISPNVVPSVVFSSFLFNHKRKNCFFFFFSIMCNNFEMILRRKGKYQRTIFVCCWRQTRFFGLFLLVVVLLFCTLLQNMFPCVIFSKKFRECIALNASETIFILFCLSQPEEEQPLWVIWWLF